MIHPQGQPAAPAPAEVEAYSLASVDPEDLEIG